MKIIIGKIISKKMQKTASVLVEQNIAHPDYKKRIKVTKKYQVQDDFDSKVGEVVRFVECKPVSKTKRWKIIEIVGRKKEQKIVVAKGKGKK
jgi:small subunit ribosomal protein S17